MIILLFSITLCICSAIDVTWGDTSREVLDFFSKKLELLTNKVQSSLPYSGFTLSVDTLPTQYQDCSGTPYYVIGDPLYNCADPTLSNCSTCNQYGCTYDSCTNKTGEAAYIDKFNTSLTIAYYKTSDSCDETKLSVFYSMSTVYCEPHSNPWETLYMRVTCSNKTAATVTRTYYTDENCTKKSTTNPATVYPVPKFERCYPATVLNGAFSGTFIPYCFGT